jgi:hypothetical protein
MILMNQLLLYIIIMNNINKKFFNLTNKVFNLDFYIYDYFEGIN